MFDLSVFVFVYLYIPSIYRSIYLSMYLSISKVVRTWEWWYVWFSELARSHTVRFHCVLKLICQKCSKRTCCLHVPFFAAHAPDVYDIFRNVTFNFKVLRQAGILFSIVFFWTSTFKRLPTFFEKLFLSKVCKHLTFCRRFEIDIPTAVWS